MPRLKKIDPKAFIDAFDEEEEVDVDVEPWSPSLSGSQQELFERVLLNTF